MKKFLKTFFLFLGFSLLFYGACVFLVGKFAPHAFKKNLLYSKGGYGYTYSRFMDAENVTGVDVLIVGSSHAYRGIDTRIFNTYGIKAFNLGTSAQTPLQSELLLKKYLKKIQPKLVIYEVYPGAFSSDGVEASLDVIANLKQIDFETLKMAVRVNHVKTYNTLIFSFLNNFVTDHEAFTEDPKRGIDTYISGQGYVARNIAYNQDTVFNTTRWTMKADQLDSFDRIVTFINENKAELVLIQAPITTNRFDAYSNNRQIDSIFEAKGTYKNFNGTIPLNDTLHFYDSHHLNQTGVELFNKELIAYLKEHSLPKE